MYILSSSCHPTDCFQNIPFSFTLRIVIICSDYDKRDLRHRELKQIWLDRDYGESVIDSAIRRATNIDGELALKPKSDSRKKQSRPVYVSTYDQRLPNIPKIINKHWRSHCYQDTNFEKTFPEPPIVPLKNKEILELFWSEQKFIHHNHEENR